MNVKTAPVNVKTTPGQPKSAPHFRWKMFLAGLAAIVAGYVLMAVNDITIAPVLLVLGYCVLVPLAFL